MTVDGAEHVLRSEIVGGWRGLLLESPGPSEREYQIDGSDTTSTEDRQADIQAFPLYGVAAWLRDENSYSRWEHLRVVDLNTGQPVTGPLPASFQVDADLRRPEAAARLWLLGPAEPLREGLELDRDRRNARWLVDRGSGPQARLPRWFFPEQPMPFLVEILHLVGRCVAAGFGLVFVTWLLGWLTRLARGAQLSRARHGTRRTSPGRADAAGSLLDLAAWSALGAWALASILVSWRTYDQLPHILDAVSYSFQAKVLDTGKLALPVPPLVDAVKGPFEVALDGRWFSQYPPGAAAAYALGGWLAGPLAGLVLLASSGWTAGRLYGPTARGIAVVLGALSPFLLFQSGSFLSHPIAGALVSLALAAFVLAEQSHPRGYLACGGFLGAAFLTREVAAVLFALPLAIRLFRLQRWRALGAVVLGGLPFLAIYVAYNAAQTGNPFLLPRAVFDPTDHFGFGDNIGFHHRHTLAAGLANTDELLTLLQFDLFGWPPLFALGLLGLPFLMGRARAWDGVAAEGALCFVVAYVAYFYHGVALGPRYYFEALPWFLVLGARGVETLIDLRGRLGAGLVVGALCAYTLLFYLPSELARRADYSGLPESRRAVPTFVEATPFGPRLIGLPDNALVLTDDWWLFNGVLSALNCPRVPECPVVFALAATDDDRRLLTAAYPGRQILHVIDTAGTLTVQ